METFLEYETICRETPPGHLFVVSFVEIDPRKVAEVVRGSRDKKQRLCDPFFRAVSETHSVISHVSTPPAKFHPNPSKFPRFIMKSTFQIVTIIGDPIGYRIANNKCHNALRSVRCGLLEQVSVCLKLTFEVVVANAKAEVGYLGLIV